MALSFEQALNEVWRQSLVEHAKTVVLALKIHDFRNTEGLAMVQIRYRGGFETKSEAFT